jgi:dolichyl-phosphate beta-glucosyltransferase
MQKICLVIPCYNEAERLDRISIEAFTEQNPFIFFLGVNDGSNDETIDIWMELSKNHPSKISVLNLLQNRGKAESVRLGLLHAVNWQQFDYIGYFDADLATPLEEVKWFLYFSGGLLQHSLIMGSRLARLGSKINRKIMRHYMGRIFATFISIILDLRVYDTQCGAKLIKAEIIPSIFEKPFISKWFFDVEILARIKKKIGKDNTVKQILEVPLRTWNDIHGSKLKLIDFFKAPYDLWRIWLTYKS